MQGVNAIRLGQLVPAAGGSPAMIHRSNCCSRQLGCNLLLLAVVCMAIERYQHARGPHISRLRPSFSLAGLQLRYFLGTPPLTMSRRSAFNFGQYSPRTWCFRETGWQNRLSRQSGGVARCFALVKKQGRLQVTLRAHSVRVVS